MSRRSRAGRGPARSALLAAAAIAVAAWAFVSLLSAEQRAGRTPAAPEPVEAGSAKAPPGAASSAFAPAAREPARGEIGDASREALREILRREASEDAGAGGRP